MNDYDNVLRRMIESLKTYKMALNTDLSNQTLGNSLAFSYLVCLKDELQNDKLFKEYLKNIDIQQKTKYVDLMEFAKWINICNKLDVNKIKENIQLFIDNGNLKNKPNVVRNSYNPIYKIARLIDKYYDILLDNGFIIEELTPEQPPQLTKTLSTDVQEYLFRRLRGKFINENTNFHHFCFVFGYTPIPANNQPLEPIKWEKCKQSLRTLLFDKAIKNDVLRPHEIQRITLDLFHDKNGKPFKLSKNQPKTTTNIHTMINILKDIPTN